MCVGTEQISSDPQAAPSQQESEPLAQAMSPVEVTVSGNSFSALLELVADNDVEGFKRSVIGDGECKVDEVGLWYGRQRASKRTVLLHRTPLMVASMYGSVEIVKLILSLSKESVDRVCDTDKSTALHCAASGGSVDAVDVVKLLLLAGADPSATDGCGNRPLDVIVSPPGSKVVALKEILKSEGLVSLMDELHVSAVGSIPSSSSLSSPLENGSLFSPSAKKEYPIDPSIPDIRNSIYASDEFRMYSFKIRPCSRSYTHDWTECPFVHPGENARRRDPKKFHYSCVPCPDHRKAPCRRADLCEYAHGVFESLLHPAQYRTRICKDGITCARRVCFFAHKPEELRPLYHSTGSAVPSPPHSASSVASMEVAVGPFTPPMSPGNGMSQASVAWPQQNIPTLHLPGNHLHLNRLRSSLNTRNGQMSPNDFSCYSPSYSIRSKDLTASSFNEHFPTEVSSPRYPDQLTPSQKSAFIHQQHKRESVLSPVKSSNAFSPKSIEHLLLQPSFQVMEPLSPLRTRMSAFANCEIQHQLRSPSARDLGSNLSRDPSDLISSPVNCWSQWESPVGKVDWSVQGDELGRLIKPPFSTGHNSMVLPEVSSAQCLAKESPSGVKSMASISISGSTFSAQCSNNAKQIDQVVALA